MEEKIKVTSWLGNHLEMKKNQVGKQNPQKNQTEVWFLRLQEILFFEEIFLFGFVSEFLDWLEG